jgi:DNA primase catalytic core
MEITDIKARLSILTVLNHYGITPNRHNMLNCPFHDDKNPSFHVYPKTNTYHCFGCGVSGDQIQFIQDHEKITKHEAILKAKQILGIPHPVKPNHKPMNNQNDLPRVAVLTKLMSTAKEKINLSPGAKQYYEKRGIDPEKTYTGFLGNRFYHSWNDKLKQSAIGIGLLKENPNGTLSPAFRNCIIFPVKNKQGQIINIYGRSIHDNGQGRHFYLKGKHEGIYPGYPAPQTKKLILCESIIDAASLLQIEAIANTYSIMAAYGTNGITDEIKQAIKELKELDEIIFMFDNDEAGRKGAERGASELVKTLHCNVSKHCNVSISLANLPEGEDINSLLQGHEPGIIDHILHERSVIFSNKKNKDIAMQSDTDVALQHSTDVALQRLHHPFNSSFNTSTPDKITWQTDLLKIEIWGGIEYSNMHRLRLSLYLENKTTNRSFRDEVNLYSNRSKKSFLMDAAEELEIPLSELKEMINQFTRETEEYRLKQKQQYKERNRRKPVTLTQQEQKQAITVLKDKNLISHIEKAMQKVGLIGETENGLLLFLVFITRNFDNPLHALVHGSSGSGKTNLLKSILKLVPPESKYETTALTENVLFRPPYKDFWKNKILLIEDLDGSYKALLPLRELMTNQYISKFASEPNPKTGKYEQTLLEAHGPVVIAGATTKDKVYEDNSNRSFLLHINESKMHQQNIIDYQNRAAAGLIDQAGQDAVINKIHNMQRMLNKDIRVINPFQPQLKLPEYVFRKLRTNTHYITLIKSITFLFQHQREKKKDSNGNLYIETTLEDVALANALSKESLLRKSDELSGAVRSFFENLKETVQQSGNDTFLAKDTRSRLRMHPMKFSRYINELRNRGYVKKVSGKEKGSYEYKITVWDDYQILQKGLNIMDSILDKLWKQYPDGIYKKRK